MNDVNLRQAGPVIHCAFDRAGLEREAADANMSEADYEGYDQIGQKEREEIAQERVWRAQETLRGIFRSLREGDHWINANGEWIAIEDISPRYAKNIVRYLRRRATFLHELACLEFVGQTPPTATEALAGFDAAFDQLNDMDPVEWLMKKRLLIRLKAKIRKYEESL